MHIIDLIPDLQAAILAARQIRDANNTLAPYLPNRPVQEVSYRLGREQRLDQIAPVRAFDSPSTPIRRPAVSDVRGDLPAVTPREDITETDLMRAQKLAQVAVDYGPGVRAAARRVALTVDNTFEQMRGQLLSSGAVTLQLADGNTQSVDFGVSEDQKFTAATAWTAAGYDGDPFEELEEWHRAYADASGTDAGVMLTTRRVVTLLSTFLRRKYPQQPIGAATVAGELAMRNLPQPQVYDRVLTDLQKNKTRVFPEGAITFLPTADQPIGETQLGPTQEAQEQMARGVLTAEQVPGLTLVTLGNDDPVQRAVKGAAIGLPILRDADAIVCVNGITG